MPLSINQSVLAQQRARKAAIETLHTEQRLAAQKEYAAEIKRAQGRKALFLKDRTHVDSEAIADALKRMRTRRNKQTADEETKKRKVASSEKLIGSASALAIALKLSQKELFVGLQHHPRESRILLRQLVIDRERFFPGTHIRSSPDKRYLVLKLINQLGREPAHAVVESIRAKSRDILRRAALVRETNEEGNAFININQHIYADMKLLEKEMQDTEASLKAVFDALHEIRTWQRALPTLELPEKTKQQIAAVLNQQGNAITHEVRVATLPKNFKID